MTLLCSRCPSVLVRIFQPSVLLLLRVSATYNSMRGSCSEAASFTTHCSVPDVPPSPKLHNRTKSSISLQWKVKALGADVAQRFNCSTCPRLDRVFLFFKGLFQDFSIRARQVFGKFPETFHVKLSGRSFGNIPDWRIFTGILGIFGN